MEAYLSNFGWHFNKKMCDFAVSLMKKINPATGKKRTDRTYFKREGRRTSYKIWREIGQQFTLRFCVRGQYGESGFF